jgi:hypothetical protein
LCQSQALLVPLVLLVLVVLRVLLVLLVLLDQVVSEERLPKTQPKDRKAGRCMQAADRAPDV